MRKWPFLSSDALITITNFLLAEHQEGVFNIHKFAQKMGRPLQNIRSIGNMQTVIKDGNIYSPKQLHAMGGFQQ